MDVEQVKSVSVWPYVGFYTLMMIGLTAVFIIFALLFPSLGDSIGKAAGFGISFGSTSFASYKFIRKYLRLFNRPEYWKITLYSTLVSCVLSFLLMGLAVAGGAVPDSDTLPPLVWIFILLLAGLVAFGINAAGYSSSIGKTYLKAELARQARTSSEPFS